MFKINLDFKDSGELFTGDGAISRAKYILDPNYDGLESNLSGDLEKSLEAGKLRVLVCCKFKKKTAVPEESLVLIKVS